MSKLIIKATNFAEITPSLYPDAGYFIIGIDTADGGFKKLDHLGVLTSIGGANLPFYGDRIVTRPGLPAVNVGPTKNVNEFVNKMFFPAQGPLLSMICDGVREFGASKTVTINYTAVTRTNPIISIIVDGNTIGPDGTANQSGSVSRTLADFNNSTFSGVVTDGTDSGYASVGINWYNKRFAFVTDTDLLDVAQTPAQISTLLNTLTSSSYSFSNTKNGNNILLPSNQYMCFAYVLNNNTAIPNIIVNTISNNAYTYRDFVYTNQYGYATIFRLLRSGNKTGGSPFNVTIG